MLTDYLAMFPGATREHPHFMALAEAILQQVCDLINMIMEINAAFSVGEAVGEQLDAVGASLKLVRNDCPQGATATDAQFRAFILEKLKLWCWDGTNENLGVLE